jgi:carbonic anhydrase/acetyltransferase-like protein (isoleucine patch superfamily)
LYLIANESVSSPTVLRRYLKRACQGTGTYRLALSLLEWKMLFPLRATNFVFQRVIGLNRDCPWAVHFTSRVTTPSRVKVHRSALASFAVSGGCYIQGGNGIEIEEGTIFAPGVKIISANHTPDDLSQHLPAEPVRIGAYCWIGANAVILPGVCLGDRVVVGAGAVVTKSVPAGCVVVGVPARIIRSADTPADTDTNARADSGVAPVAAGG